MAECKKMEKKQFSRRESDMGESKERSINIKRSKLTLCVCACVCVWACVCVCVCAHVCVHACLCLCTQRSQNQILMADYMVTEEPEIKLQTSAESLKKQESSKKKHLFLLY